MLIDLVVDWYRRQCFVHVYTLVIDGHVVLSQVEANAQPLLAVLDHVPVGLAGEGFYPYRIEIIVPLPVVLIDFDINAFSFIQPNFEISELEGAPVTYSKLRQVASIFVYRMPRVAFLDFLIV